METRNISFDMVLWKIINNDFIGQEKKPTRDNQYRIIVHFNDYPYVVPFIKDAEGNWFLKTIFPNRKEKWR